MRKQIRIMIKLILNLESHVKKQFKNIKKKMD
jgi:hypothetical protein